MEQSGSWCKTLDHALLWEHGRVIHLPSLGGAIPKRRLESIRPVASLCRRVSAAWLPIARCSLHIMLDHTQEGHHPKHPRDERTESDRCPALLNAGLPKELIQLLVNQDALGVARGRESRIRYNSVDVTAGLAY
jgi:hypothetical protein